MNLEQKTITSVEVADMVGKEHKELLTKQGQQSFYALKESIKTEIGVMCKLFSGLPVFFRIRFYFLSEIKFYGGGEVKVLDGAGVGFITIEKWK